MSHPPRDFGVVFDIDGVLLRGEDLIPGSREAVLKVSSVVGDGSFLNFRQGKEYKNWESEALIDDG